VAQRTYRTRAVECPVTDPAVIQAADNERQHPVSSGYQSYSLLEEKLRARSPGPLHNAGLS
jgi:hypothetical protein